MKEVYFVTGNKGKLESARKAFSKYDIEVKNIDLNTKELEINDIETIAIDKVLKAYSILKEPCICNDSGFYIEALGNFPGAFVKRNLLDVYGIDGLLNLMKNEKNRNCYFEDCSVYYDGTDIKIFHSYSKGILSLEKHEIDSDKKWSPLWYVFIPEGYDKTLSQFTQEELNIRSENKDSALKELAKYLSESNTKKLVID